MNKLQSQINSLLAEKADVQEIKEWYCYAQSNQLRLTLDEYYFNVIKPLLKSPPFIRLSDDSNQVGSTGWKLLHNIIAIQKEFGLKYVGFLTDKNHFQELVSLITSKLSLHDDSQLNIVLDCLNLGILTRKQTTQILFSLITKEYKNLTVLSGVVAFFKAHKMIDYDLLIVYLSEWFEQYPHLSNIHVSQSALKNTLGLDTILEMLFGFNTNQSSEKMTKLQTMIMTRQLNRLLRQKKSQIEIYPDIKYLINENPKL